MNFLHPWALGIGLLALTIPFLIHFFTRPRPKTVPLSTIRFVQSAVKQRRKQSWLRDALVLALRAIAIACIAWTFARPLFQAEPVADVDSSASVKRVVILDASQSMAAVQKGADSFQSARVEALRFLEQKTGLRANLILAAANPDAVFETPSSNMNILSDALGRATAQPQSIDVQAAVNAAAKMLTNTEGVDAAQELVIVSDFQRTNWATVDFSSLPEATKIKLESTAPEKSPDNIAIVSAGFTEKPTAGNEANLSIVVGNYSGAARNVKLQVDMADGQFGLEQLCLPNVETTINKSVLIQSPGWQTGTATLQGNEDALRADDKFSFVVQSINRPNATMITRQSAAERPSSSYFLERALSPYDDQSDAGMKINRVGPARFTADAVANSQILIFDHPGQLEMKQIQLLGSLIRRGRGVMYVAAEPVDGTNLKRLYDVLGSDLQAPVLLQPPRRGEQRKSLTIGSVKSDRRPFSVFGDSLNAQLSDLKFSGGLATSRIPNSLDDDVLATLGDQSVLMFTSPAGLGNLCVLNADLNESNFPRHPSFVTIISELVDGLLRSNNRMQTTHCGEPLTRLLPTDVTSADGIVVEEMDADSAAGKTVDNSQAVNVGENGESNKGTFQSSGEGVVWNWKRLAGPGAFHVNQNNKTVYAIASHIPAEESDLRTLDSDVMVDRLGGGKSVSFNRITQTTTANDNSWIWFAVTAVVALVAEVVVLQVFRM